MGKRSNQHCFDSCRRKWLAYHSKDPGLWRLCAEPQMARGYVEFQKCGIVKAIEWRIPNQYDHDRASQVGRLEWRRGRTANGDVVVWV